MATPVPMIDVLGWMRKMVGEEGGDVLRQMLATFIHAVMGAEADALCGAPYGSRDEGRVNTRNGSRERPFDTRMGTIPLHIPKLRTGTYYPDWLLQHRRRSERALVTVVAEAYLKGISTRRVEGLVRALGVESLSKSQVSVMAKELDEMVEQFRSRPLDNGPYSYVWIDALTQKCREDGRVINVAGVCATAVNGKGQREVLGFDVITTEDGAGWLAFLKGLVARGLSGAQLVISDDHQGLKNAIGATLPGASWQRCRVHFMRNLLTRVPKSAQEAVATLVRTIFYQPSAELVTSQLTLVVERLDELQFHQAALLLEEAGPDILAFAPFPKEHWRQIWSNNPQERLNKEIRRRTDVVGIFPNRTSIIRLVGALLAELNDEWIEGRRYLSLESLAKLQRAPIPLSTAKKSEVKSRLRKAA